MPAFPEHDPRHHTSQMRQRLEEDVAHLREDVTNFSDPRARALFEVSADVLIGLLASFERYEEGDDAAWSSARWRTLPPLTPREKA